MLDQNTFDEKDAHAYGPTQDTIERPKRRPQPWEIPDLPRITHYRETCISRYIRYDVIDILDLTKFLIRNLHRYFD